MPKETTLKGSYRGEFPDEASVSTLSTNNIRYVRSCPDLGIELGENTLLTLVDFQNALKLSTMARMGFSMSIQASNSQCSEPELFLLTNDQDLRPMSEKDAFYDGLSASISRVKMEKFAGQKGRIGVRIPPSGVHKCVYIGHWTNNPSSEELPALFEERFSTKML